MKKEIPITIAAFIFAFMLLYCWNKSLPYLYFQMIRNLGMVVFALIAYINFERNNITFVIIFGMSMLIIQPFIKIPLGRFNWNILDTIWAVLLIFNGCWILKYRK